MLRAVVDLGDLVTANLYGDYEGEARKRLGIRDPEDWPMLAPHLRSVIDLDPSYQFLGCGAVMWISNRVEISFGD